VILALAGLREPVVLILLAIAFFTAISGKPLDGVLMLVVAVGLAWDAGRRARSRPPAPRRVPAPGRSPTDASSPAGVAEIGRSARADHGQLATARAPAVTAPAGALRRWVAGAALLVAGVLYARVVGTFSRYSWPATAAVVSLGVVVVLIGWHGPLRVRPSRGRLPVVGTALWAVVLVLGCLWELAALLRQPSLTATSYAHPTISALTDPVLASSGGRSAVLAVWLAIGWYLVRR